ncbi:MupA/Atu3671 family FMN-dependent luciferase-like monooxygenase [Tabrizicola sp. M-4]|uniref:MupA/Atu3671 family FMN-dependent luciferase-like monooxygenase n=1 Tax=Tabrizicola sp. M-4 TaxID=3055847 RepID=UPI003DA8AA61
MTLSALLVGNESLTAECGNLWLDRGHRIAAVITREAKVADWAAGHGLPVIAPGAGLAARCEGLSVDWVLSVANLSLVPDAVLARASKGGVNFHDGPLPAYAGLNAPVWAMLAGETRHGITWHLMTKGIDEGDILATRDFDIADDDTAFTLNARCFAAAIDSFAEVVTALEQGGHPRHPQPAGTRHVYMRADRPAAAARLDFTRPAADLARMVRALDHGAYRNPLALPKIEVEGRLLAVTIAEAETASAAPGTVLESTPAGLVVACGTGSIRLAGLRAMDGATVCPGTLRATHIASPSSDEAARLTSALAPVAQAEQRARALLASADPVTIGTPPGATADWRVLPLPLAAASPARVALATLRATGRSAGDIAIATAANAPLHALPWFPARIAATGPAARAEAAATDAIAFAQASGGIAADLALREPGLPPLTPPPVALSDRDEPLAGSAVTLSLTPAGARLHYDATRLPMAEAQALADRIARIATAIDAAGPEADLAAHSALTAEETARLSAALAATAKDYDRSLTIPAAVLQETARRPDHTAVIAGKTRLSYAQLTARAARIANILRGMGVQRGMLVGLACHRGADMIAGALGIQMAGAAYVPMDPAYPADRLALYAEDSGAPVIVTESSVAPALPDGPQRLLLDTDPRLDAAATNLPENGPQADDLAYVIYTSGSTGRPKGVMVTHRNVINFFAGMDDAIGTDPGTWLAVTSMSFDISVLELFWTLTRGFTVVVADEAAKLSPSGGPAVAVSSRQMEFSLYYWGNDDGQGPKKYELLLEGAKFADTHGFCAVWTPERHFHAFGGPYPNPSVTGAAVAAVTRNIGVRAGSCVAPLHHPARIAEEWAVIDNLTNGRAALAIASGWQPDDFILRPENTPPANRQAMLDSITTLRRLWKGEAVEFPRKDGSMFGVVTQPRPVSKDLPVWVTTAGNSETWRDAGRLGANVLTHLLGQSVAEVGDKVKIYRAALAEAGHDPAAFKVTLMLHTYLAADRDTARETARGPMKDYLRSAAGLIKQYAWAFPAFKKPQGIANPMEIDLGSLDAEELEAILDFAFQRYFEESGLFGTVEDALARVEEVKSIDVDEIACLIDYGIPASTVLSGLIPLAEVLRRANGEAADDGSLAGLIRGHRVTHLQCTPSMARMLAEDDGARDALRGVKRMMVGGEALPGKLASDLSTLIGGPVLNMYGPTETTIWSSVEATTGGDGTVNIGQPIANTALYVLDEDGAPVPDGTEGELWIGGEGVAAGYFKRDDLTADRFRPDPFAGQGRMYRTGDLVRRRADGRLDFLGRADHQVKIRGHRIELGEIESVLDQAPGIRQSVVIPREDIPGDVRLVAYVTHDGPVDEARLRAHLAETLPDVMVPAHVVPLDSFPLTPNRKVDRKALPAPSTRAAALPTSDPVAAPTDSVEAAIAEVWAKVLGVPSVGRSDNFFTLGGHSLLAVQAHRELKARLNTARLAITDIFRFPVLSSLAAHLGQGSTPQPAAIKPMEPELIGAGAPAADQGGSRSDAMARRRAMREARERAKG